MCVATILTSSSGSIILAMACDTGSSSEDLARTSVFRRGENREEVGGSSLPAVEGERGVKIRGLYIIYK